MFTLRSSNKRGQLNSDPEDNPPTGSKSCQDLISYMGETEGQRSRHDLCSLCRASGLWEPMTSKEIEVIEELVLPSFKDSRTSSNNWLCVSCSSTLERLTKLRSEIKEVISSLRALAKWQAQPNRNAVDKRTRIKAKGRGNKDQSKSGGEKGHDDEEPDFDAHIKIEPDDDDFYDGLDLDLMDDHDQIDAGSLVHTKLEDEEVENVQETRKRRSTTRTTRFQESEDSDDGAATASEDSDANSYSNCDDDSESDFEQEFGGREKRIRIKRSPNDLDPLECGVCGKKCDDPGSLQVHKGQHPENCCDICDLTFKTGPSFESHLSSKIHDLGKRARRKQPDENQPVFGCSQCNDLFHSVSTLSDHIKSSHKGSEKYCRPCDMRFKYKQSYDGHLLTDKHAMQVGGDAAVAELQAKKKFTCDTCSRKYMTAKMLKQHVQFYHERNKVPHICELCGKVLATPYSFKCHMAQVHSGLPKKKAGRRFVPPEDKPHSCKQCDRRYADRKGLYDHIKRTHEGVRYKCELCPRDFGTQITLRAHKGTVHGDQDGLQMVAAVKAKRYTNSSKIDVGCVFCPKILKGKNSLGKHLELVHLSDRNSCPFGCLDSFENEPQWLSHVEQCQSEKMAQMEPISTTCTICRATFPNILLKIVHLLQSHQTYPCPTCGMGFTSQDAVNRHHSVHSGAEPFLCTKCGKRFSRPDGLRVHLKTSCGTPEEKQKNREKRAARSSKKGAHNSFLCSKCGKGFRCQRNLTLHSTTVCGEDEDAKREAIAKRQANFKNYKQKEKPHPCHQCSKAFVTETRLEDHRRKVHHDIQSQNYPYNYHYQGFNG